MKPLLVGTAVSLIALVLTSFALNRAAPISYAPGAQAVAPLRLSDLTLDRVFRQTIAVPLGSSGGSSVTMPPTVGFVITSITRPVDPNYGVYFAQVLSLSVDGALAESVPFGLIGIPNSSASVFLGQRTDLTMPLVVKPGHTLTLQIDTGPGSGTLMTFAGYTIFPGEA